MDKDPIEKGNGNQKNEDMSEDFEFEIIDDGNDTFDKSQNEDEIKFIDNDNASEEESKKADSRKNKPNKKNEDEIVSDDEIRIIEDDSLGQDENQNENQNENQSENQHEKAVEHNEENEVTHTKITKDQIMNRVMIGCGILILGFTAFFGCVVYGAIHKRNTPVTQLEETTIEPTTVVQETTTQKKEESVFVSTNSDASIGENVKTLINNSSTKPINTGMDSLDSRVKNVLSLTCTKDMTMYEKVRNIYDYMMYYCEVTNKSYVDQDTIYEACSSVDYISDFDMEVIYRANKLLANQAGSSMDYACAFTVLLRKLGLEAYYVKGEKNVNSETTSEGYTIVVLNGQKYIFDVAAEDEISKNATVEYKMFCKTLDELGNTYLPKGIQECMNQFESFATLGKFSLSATFTSGEYSAEGSVNYQKDGNEVENTAEASGDIELYLGETVNITAAIGGSTNNTWKLIAKVYDEEMNFQTEATVYSETSESDANEIVYTPGRVGKIKLLLMATDSNGRTCTVYKTILVKTKEEPTTQQETTTEETTTAAKEASTGEPAVGKNPS